MRRRSVLRRGAALPGALAFGGVARAQDDRTPTDTPPAGTPDSAGTSVLGRLPLPDAKEAVVDAAGRTAYVAISEGFAVVDVSDPADPAVLVENRDPLSERDTLVFDVYDVKLDTENDLLAVVAPSNPGAGNAFHGLVVYDVSDRANPERVSVHETDFFNHNCDIAGGYAYLCGNGEAENALVIVDAATGEAVGRWSIADVEPRWRDVRSVLWVLHDVHVRDDLAFCSYWDAGTWIVDVSDPAAPELVTKVRGRDPSAFASMNSSGARAEATAQPGNDHTSETSEDGTLLAIGVEAWAEADDYGDPGGPGGITLYDISDPADPVEEGYIAPPPTPDPTFSGVWTTSHNFELRNGRLYSAWYRGGVRVHDVRDPAAPVEIAAWRDASDASFWTAQAATPEFFVAPARKRRDDEGTLTSDEAALYTFSDPPDGAAGTGGGGSGTGADGAGNGTDTGSTTTGDGPGFGVLSTVAGLGAGAWYALRRRRGGE
jgi:PGF-CTERM protein